MRVLTLCLLLTALALPAHAGHGTIEETDDAFIVEYTGDASDKAADNKADNKAKSPALVPRAVNRDQSPVAVPRASSTPVDPAVQTQRQDADDPRADRRSQSKRTRPARPAPTPGDAESED